LKTYYRSDVESLDFRNNAESARQKINSYVEGKTSQKIKDLFAVNSLDKAAMVLVNALYFKSAWKNKFNVSETSKKPFSSNEKDQTMVDMMSKSGSDFYYNDNDAEVHVLGLPFNSPNENEWSAYIILPLKRFGLDDAIKNMTADRFQNLINNAKMRTIQRVDIPKFKLDKEFQSQDSFKMLGVIDAFSPDKADFSGINGFKDLYASSLTHKVSLEFSEEGVEAIGSSGTIATQRAIQRPVVFSVDQPFMLAVVEKRSSIILFLGSISKLA
jgi:serpin B